MALTGEHSPPVTQALVACRGCLCLATTGKMYCFETADLKKEFFNITGLEVSPGDGLPQHICHACCGLLRKATEFRNKCHSTHDLLSSHPVTLEFIQNINMLPGPPLKKTNIVSANFNSNSVDLQMDAERDNQNHLNHEEKKDTDLQSDIKKDIQNHLNKENPENDLVNSQEDTDFKWASDDNLNDNDQSDNDFTTVLDVKLDSRVEKVEDKCKKCIPFGKIYVKSGETEADTMEIEFASNDSTVEYTKMLHQYIQDKYVSKTFKSDSLKSFCSNTIKLHNYLREKYDYHGKSKNQKKECLLFRRAKNYNFNVEFFSNKEEEIENFRARMDTDKYKLSKFKCTVCYIGFQNEQNYKKHRERHDSATHNYKCEVCKLRYLTSQQLSGHARCHKQKLTCNQCGISFLHVFAAKLRDHFKSHNGGTKYECKYCSHVSYKKSSLHAHVYRHHGSVSCGICHFMLSPSAIEGHIKRQHVKKFTCSSCDKVFNDYAAIAKHIHTSPNGVCGADAWPCAKCGENLSTESDLRDHVDWCRRRNYALIEERRRLRHATMTTGEKPSVGPECPETSPIELGWQQQRQEAPTNPRTRIVCEWCAKIMRPSQYRVHARVHTGEKPFACPECPKTFRIKLGLKNHMALHTGARPHQCAECGKAFAYSSSLVAHRQCVHEKLRPHACPICDMRFFLRSNVTKHMNSFHTNEPPNGKKRKRNGKGEKKRAETGVKKGSDVKKAGKGVKKGRGVKKVGSDVKKERGVKKVGRGVKK